MMSATYSNTGVVMQALEVVHSCGLAHLDLKCNNARVNMDVAGQSLHLTLIDFGSARPSGSGTTAFHLRSVCMGMQHNGISTDDSLLLCDTATVVMFAASVISMLCHLNVIRHFFPLS